MVISSVFMDWRTGTNRHQTLLGLATWFLIAVTVAVLVDRFVERPLRRLLRPKRRPVAETALVSG
jgi:peptidoglycan/LPS O-acetylase OafA/YrhL